MKPPRWILLAFVAMNLLLAAGVLGRQEPTPRDAFERWKLGLPSEHQMLPPRR